MKVATKVKLNYPVLPVGHEVWMVRPGAGYRLYDAFKKASAFAPDIPKLSLSSPSEASDEANINAQIRRGLAWRKWEQEGFKENEKPNTSLEYYRNMLGDDGVAHTRLKNIARQIFNQIPSGSLIFIPHHALEGKALMGIATHIEHKPIQLIRQWGIANSLEFQGRSMLDLVEVPMKLLPDDIASIRKNRGIVVTKITDSEHISALYKEYFKTFSLYNSDSYAQYRTGDRELPGGALSGLIAVMRFSLDVEPHSNTDVDYKSKTYKPDHKKMLMRSLEPSSDLLLHARVNSPFGRVTFQSKRELIFVGAALISLATLDADAQVISDIANKNIQVENVCESLANDRVAANIQAQAIKDHLFDFYATYGADSCTQVLTALRKTVNNTDGRLDIEAQ